MTEPTPVGDRSAEFDHAIAMEHVDESTCWALLRDVDVGRLAIPVDDEGVPGVQIFPVNHVVDLGSIVFRTALGTKLSQITDREDRPMVAFEADNADAGSGRTEGELVAWSVVVHGHAELITTSTDVFDSFDIHVHPWHASRKPFFVRLVPHRVSGRRFVVTRR